jgi:hypothetical protein
VLLSRRCLILTLPPVFLAVLGLACALLMRRGAVSTSVGSVLISVAGVAALVVALCVAMPVGGLLVPLVADLVITRGAPHPPSTAPPVAEVARALWRSLPSTLATFVPMMMAAVVVGIPLTLLTRRVGVERYGGMMASLLILVAMSAAMAPFAVYGIVAAMERVGGLKPLRRSATLLRPMWRAAFGVQLFYGVLTQALPAVLLLVLQDVTRSLPSGTSTTFEVWKLLLELSTGLLAPFVLVPLALLYLRAREAEGDRVVST